MTEDIHDLRDRIAELLASHARLYAALDRLVTRCDGPEGVREDGSNIPTYEAHAALEEARDR